MKRLATLLLAAGLVFGISTGASAVDFKAKGRWIMDFEYGQNGGFVGTKGNGTGWMRDSDTGNSSGDEFDARQRLRLTLEAVASENLSGTVQFEIGQQRWGRGDGALGSDGNVVRLKHSYIDWIVPQTDLKVRMGLQPLALPSFSAGSQILDTDVAGVSLNYQFTENVGLTFFWARPYNDNGGYNRGNYRGDDDRGPIGNYMDNVDMFALALPMTFDGVKVTPFGMLGFMGPGALDNNYQYRRSDGRNELALVNGGMTPWGGPRHRHGGSAAGERLISSYGTAWWAGLTADITMFDPFRFAFDFNYGSVDWQDEARLNRRGWIAAALAEYKMDWGIPGIVGWYASGDDGDPSNGSERMPYLSNNTSDNDFSNFAFSGGPTITRESVIGTTMVGTWGIGLRIRDMSFIEDLKHTFRVNYIGGTNSPKMVRKMARDPKYREWGNTGPGRAWQIGEQAGVEGLYMTTNDSAVEFALQNEYKIYENLKVLFNASYLATSLGNNRIRRGDWDRGDRRRANISDPWNINLQFQYAF